MVIQDGESHIDTTKYTDDDDSLLEGLIEHMKKDSKLGEDMIKKRLDQKRKDNEAKVGKVPEEAKQLLDNKNRTYKNNRLEMSELPEGETVSVPVIM